MFEEKLVGEEALAALCRRLMVSDRDAFEQVFRLFRDDLLRFTHSIVREGSVAQDLVQDVFLDLWGRRRTLDARLSLKAYLFRMARNRAYRHLRDERAHAEKHRQIRRDNQSMPGSQDDAAAKLDADDLTRRLHRWIAELPVRQREALLLSRMHALSHQEIAAVMEISPRTVNNHMIRALSHLRARIQDFEPLLLEQ